MTVKRVLPMRVIALLVMAVALFASIQVHGQGAAAPAPSSSTAWGPLQLLDREIPAGQKRKFRYQLTQTFEGSFLDTVVFVARGAKPGPTLCLTALIHGDERNGFEIVRESFARLDPARLSGTLIAVPAANANGFRTGSRYMPDRRDLNRAFPGKAGSDNTALIAGILYSTLSEHCDALIDLHTGSFDRANLPQVRVDLANAKALELARRFGATVVLGGAGPKGSLRREMMDAGIPSIIYEAGLPLRFEPMEIEHGVQGVRNIMIGLGMSNGQATAPTPEARIFSRANWVRVPLGNGGVFYPVRKLGDSVRKGDFIARIFDPFTDERFDLPSPLEGQIIGMAVPQIVFSGYALVHVASAPVSEARAFRPE
ncbi:MAG: succinylglutamate desuccinylase/aspartoacylase family protein [Chromatiales bacterium]|nr:succinylglutamate desuccinylase/aspartoacylase family protein [Chromatiales bacterium]